ncbi:hypothetical protein ACLM5J_04705 [Nocardioides sp. Bht2]
MDMKTVDDALAGVRTGLEADGFKLYAQSVDEGGDVVVALEAGTADCLECLVPDAILERMVDQAVREQNPGLGTLSLVKIGFEGIDQH